mgnify:CR=1 FL=1|jgi:hypothetical protein
MRAIIRATEKTNLAAASNGGGERDLLSEKFAALVYVFPQGIEF